MMAHDCCPQVLDICFDWAGQRVATSSSDNSARIYDVRADFRELAVMKGHREEVSKVSFVYKVFTTKSIIPKIFLIFKKNAF